MSEGRRAGAGREGEVEVAVAGGAKGRAESWRGETLLRVVWPAPSPLASLFPSPRRWYSPRNGFPPPRSGVVQAHELASPPPRCLGTAQALFPRSVVAVGPSEHPAWASHAPGAGFPF